MKNYLTTVTSPQLEIRPLGATVSKEGKPLYLRILMRWNDAVFGKVVQQFKNYLTIVSLVRDLPAKNYLVIKAWVRYSYASFLSRFHAYTAHFS